MTPIAPLKGLYHVLILTFVSSFVFGQSIFTNPITGTNPNTSNPYITGQTVDGSFMTEHPIYLKDILYNVLHNLSDSDYSFTSETGVFNDRFEVGYNANILSSTNAIISNNSVRIVNLKNGHVQIRSPNGLEIKNVSIFDLLGRKLCEFKGQDGYGIYDLSTLKNAVYIAQLELSNGAVIAKKSIKKQ